MDDFEDRNSDEKDLRVENRQPDEYKGWVSMKVSGPEFWSEESSSDRMIGLCEEADDEGIPLPQRLANEGARIRERIVGCFIDWGSGWVNVVADPIGMQLWEPKALRSDGRSEEYIARRLEELRSLPYPVSGKAAHSWMCANEACPGCWHWSFWREEIAFWLKQVPELFDRRVRRATVMARRVGAVSADEVVPIAAAFFEAGEPTDILVTDKLPAWSEIGWFFE